MGVHGCKPSGTSLVKWKIRALTQRAFIRCDRTWALSPGAARVGRFHPVQPDFDRPQTVAHQPASGTLCRPSNQLLIPALVARAAQHLEVLFLGHTLTALLNY